MIRLRLLGNQKKYFPTASETRATCLGWLPFIFLPNSEQKPTIMARRSPPLPSKIALGDTRY